MTAFSPFSVFAEPSAHYCRLLVREGSPLVKLRNSALVQSQQTIGLRTERPDFLVGLPGPT
jgi:hypothetical protein